MQLIRFLIDLILHLDRYLDSIIQRFEVWTYLILFFVIFMETGFVVTPFLPGDSLIFAAGAFSARSDSPLNIYVLFPLLCLAAVAGDTVNYWVGHYIGPRAFSGNIRWLKKEYLDRTHAFFEKHGGKTIILARFVPIIRTFAPFVAGVGEMTYWRFLTYNVVGGVLWVALFSFGGYFFGNLPVVEKNFSLVIIAIVVLSVMPAVVEYIKERRQTPKAPASVGE
jgi:membrane-associated protein